MKLLDRYLQAVKFWLPRAQKQDIVAELSEDIRSQVRDEEERLGRALNEAELEAILKRYGNPMLVAERYLSPGGQHLIGPMLFPMYRFVLKLALVFYLVPWFLVWICLAVFSPAYRADHPGLELIGTLHSLWTTAIYVFAFVTLIFALVDRAQARSGFLDNWSLGKLPAPAVPDPNRVSRPASIVELAWSVLLTLWGLNLREWARSPAVWTLDEEGIRITLAPIWQNLYWPLIALLVAGILLAAFNLWRPLRTRLHLALNLARGAFTVVLISLVLRAGMWEGWVEIIAQNFPAKAAEAAKWANLTVAITLVIIGIATIVEMVRDARRMIQWKRLRPPAIPGLAAAAALGVATSMASKATIGG